MKTVKLYKKITVLGCLLFANLTMPSNSGAEQVSDTMPSESSLVDIIQPVEVHYDDTKAYASIHNTHPNLTLTPDKSEIIRLKKEAGSVIIGNPAHISALTESAKTIVLVPKMPGATYMTILDKQQNVIMQRHIIVGAQKEKYVRIRKACAGGEDDCRPTQVYFCPDLCHEIAPHGDDRDSTQTADASEADVLPNLVEDAPGSDEN